MKHLIPEYPDIIEYKNDYNTFISGISEKMGFVDYCTRCSPYLMSFPKETYQQIKIFHDVLIKAIQQIINNYCEDYAIQEIVSLCENKKKLVKLADKNPYQIFSIRPDFLVSKDNEVKVCEINARFTINGFVGAQFITEQIQESYEDEMGLESASLQIIKNYMARFDFTKPLFLLRDKEKGYDLNLLKQYLIKRGWQIIDIKPIDLSCQKKHLYAKGKVCEQMILELHQDELTKINEDLLELLINKVHCENDIRTMLIAHDKRLLAVLTNSEIMRQYMSSAEVDILQQYIINTFPIEKVVSQIIGTPEAWVLKKHGSGKGEGMYIGKEVALSELKAVIEQNQAEYIAQPYIQQKKIKLFFDDKQNICNVVGMVISINGEFGGIGFFRASPKSIIALSRGGCIIVPSIR